MSYRQKRRTPGRNELPPRYTRPGIATKYRIGKFPQGGTIIEEWAIRIREDRFEELPISSLHALRVGRLPGEHRDPFDRMLAAQGILEELPVISMDPAISSLAAA